MKYFLLPLLIATAFVYHAGAQAPALQPGSVVIKKIEPAGIKTPEFNITGGPQHRSKSLTWIEIEVEFETKVEDIAELKFEYMLQLGQTLVTGTVNHINIPKGPEHFSVMYLAPRTIEKILGNKPLSGASIGNVWITVSSPDGVLLHAKGHPKDAPPPNAPRFPGLLSKEVTPFAPLFFDRYEAVRSTR